MKRLFLVILLVVMAAGLAMAQTYPPTAGNPTSTGGAAAAPLVDVLGAHNNYGRGCAGCHAPHSGNKGEGGNAASGTTADPWTGTNALFGQDMGPLFGKTLNFTELSSSGTPTTYELTAPSAGNPTGWTTNQYSDVRGIIMCLACHDGVVARGAMMTNYAYEQQIGALPSTYGSAQIPTLLGIAGAANGFSYQNNHPIGENATVSAAMGSTYYNNTTNGLSYTVSAANKITAVTPAGQYAQFVASYGAPALMMGAHSYGTPVNASGLPYLVCTTCHNQHVMNVFAASTANTIAGGSTGTYATYFFVNGPYNINNVTVPRTAASSTTQSCRQCHFGESNEANGGTLATSF